MLSDLAERTLLTDGRKRENGGQRHLILLPRELRIQEGSKVSSSKQEPRTQHRESPNTLGLDIREKRLSWC